MTAKTAEAARRARLQRLVLLPAVAAIVFVHKNRIETDLPVRVGTAVAIVVLGFWIARDLGRSAEPILYRRMDRATAGTASFLIRLVFLVAAILTALRFAGLRPETLAVGGAITAAVVGLAAQQTFGNGLLEEHVRTPTRDAPNISLEEIDAEEVVLRIAATPAHESDGPRLADEILAAMPDRARGQTMERLLARAEVDRFSGG